MYCMFYFLIYSPLTEIFKMQNTFKLIEIWICLMLFTASKAKAVTAGKVLSIQCRPALYGSRMMSIIISICNYWFQDIKVTVLFVVFLIEEFLSANSCHLPRLFGILTGMSDSPAFVKACCSLWKQWFRKLSNWGLHFSLKLGHWPLFITSLTYHITENLQSTV